MIAPYIARTSGLDRRSFLRAAANTFGLPLLDAMTPVFSRAAAAAKAPRRMVCVMTSMGVMPRYFFPKKTGGFKHGQHLAHDATHNTPLANLFVTMLQQLGLETDKFASSTGTLTGLQSA